MNFLFIVEFIVLKVNSYAKRKVYKKGGFGSKDLFENFFRFFFQVDKKKIDFFIEKKILLKNLEKISSLRKNSIQGVFQQISILQILSKILRVSLNYLDRVPHRAENRRHQICVGKHHS